MKIIIATPLYPPEIDLLAVYAEGVAKGLCAKNQVTVLTYAGQTENTSGFEIIKINKHQQLLFRLGQYIWQSFWLAKTADIIYAQNAVATGWPAAIIKFFWPVELVINFNEDEAWKRALHLQLTDKSLTEFLQSPGLDKKTIQLIKIQQWTLKRADKILVPNKLLAEVVKEKYKISSDKIIINPSPEAKAEILPFPVQLIPQQIYIATKLYKWSNLDNLIEAISLLVNDWPQVKLFISGDGPSEAKLKKIASNFNITERVIFLGKISTAENQYLSQTSQMQIKTTENFSAQALATEIATVFSNNCKIMPGNSWEAHLDKLTNIFKSFSK